MDWDRRVCEEARRMATSISLFGTWHNRLDRVRISSAGFHHWLPETGVESAEAREFDPTHFQCTESPLFHFACFSFIPAFPFISTLLSMGVIGSD